MASNSNLCNIFLTFFLIATLLAIEETECSRSLAIPTKPVSASTACESTQFPGYCKGILIQTKPNQTVYEYGRFSFKRSVSQASKFLRVVNRYLSRARHLRLTPLAIGALEDCRLLAELNLDFLSESLNTVKEGSSSLSSSKSNSLPLVKSDDIMTLLSGALTNQQTCLDGIKSAGPTWSLKNGVAAPLSNDTKLYSISLSLFTKAWVPQRRKASHHRHGSRKKSSFRLPEAALGILGRRKLVDEGDDEEVLISDMVIVSKDGSGNFTTINDAVAAAPNKSDGSKGYFLIYVAGGVYEEYVNIDKKKRYVMMIGDGINQTIITGKRSVLDNYTTFHSATFAVVGTGFVGINMTIRNTAGAIKHQAVALRNGADFSTFYSCSFEGYQDTLYVHSLRQFYRECDIYGTVDFIFGNAAVVFQNCNLYARLPMANQFNAITAQGRTDPNQNTGISIYNCTIRPAYDLANSNGTTQTYLGRPWKQYSRTVYMHSFIDSAVNPAGWREWNGTFALDTLYYGEYNNKGPGANTTNRVNWPGYHVMHATDTSNFTVSTFVFGDNWLPQTGIPYASGLI